jgi:hypothetical protein
MMKRLLFCLAITLATALCHGQKSIDALFENYAGRDGFVNISIKGDLLKFIAVHDDDNNEENGIPAKITEIRILTQKDDHIKVENFYDKVIKDIDIDLYEEFMRVIESDQDLRMLVRSEGKTFREFLLIAGGRDNVIVQIKGDMTYEEAKRFSKGAKKNHGLNIVADIGN